jgi:two-component system response regulator AtoC
MAPPRESGPPDALVLEDDAGHREALETLIRREGFTTRGADSVAAARRMVEERLPDVVLADLRLPDGSGMDLLESFGPQPLPDFILVTAHATVDSAVDALRRGARDYLTKPVDVARLKVILANVARALDLKHQVIGLRGQLRQLGRFGSMIGVSKPMQQVYDMITRVAPTEASVFLTGESGTGKELAAQTIHELSDRRGGPFVAINCGAIAANLIESEMFGHERGSFTGATQRHRGHFERATGGTLFLDEITEMPLELQVKLLRVLETGILNRIGGSEDIETDVRVVAASNRDAARAVAGGALREDLYYRLNVFPITLPPLRERPGDVELLAEYFLARLNEENETSVRFAESARRALERHTWPGNVRELFNLVHRAYIMAGEEIDAACLPAELGVRRTIDPERAGPPVGVSLKDAERDLILRTYEHTGRDKKRTAKILGISLKTLYNRLNAYKQD